MMEIRRWCRIDSGGCVYCGSRQYTQSSVINHELAATWELSPRERQLFDRREGNFCSQCGMSRRVRMLAWTVKQLFPDLKSKAVLHFNQINHFHQVLQGVAKLVETIYRPELKGGEQVNGLVNQDMTRLEFADSSFDLAVHSDTLEHIADHERALSEVRRVLKPGGVQVYTIPLLHKRITRQRIGLDTNGRRMNLLPPSGHGSEGEYPVVWEFGGDFLRSRKPWITQVHYDNYWMNPTVFVISERKSL
jgi:SAM-dependent methyltransferase